MSMPWAVQVDACYDQVEKRQYILRIFDTESAARKFGDEYKRQKFKVHIWCLDRHG